MMIEYKGLPRGLNEFRKHFSGYLKGMYNSHPVRQDVVVMNSFEQIEERLMKYREETINRET
jgi:tRNA-dihydrouridine synthase